MFSRSSSSSSSSSASMRSIQLIAISVFLYCSATDHLAQAQQLQPQTKMTSNDNSYQVVQLPGPRTKLGEGPVWDIDTQSLYYVDINTPAVHRYDYAENRTYSAKLGKYSEIPNFHDKL
uniref:SGL domain-containing protein n=1 Tax=Anopheles maculatus TaxID=74869 RepID=A0A182SCH6_9DIPT